MMMYTLKKFSLLCIVSKSKQSVSFYLFIIFFSSENNAANVMEPAADQDGNYYDELSDDEVLDEDQDVLDQIEAINDEDAHNGKFFKQFLTNV